MYSSPELTVSASVSRQVPAGWLVTSAAKRVVAEGSRCTSRSMRARCSRRRPARQSVLAVSPVSSGSKTIMM
jgi:hypothetical protein